MWIVAKIKKKELSIFKDNLIASFGKETKFYHPKIEYHKYFKNSVEKKDKKILVENFLNDYENLFGYDYIEQIDKRIDKGNFKENFLNISQHGMLNRKDFILNLYKSYHLT